MIFDKEVMWADDDDVTVINATPIEIDIGAIKGPGEVILVNMTGKDLAGTGPFYIYVEGSNDGTNWGEEMHIYVGPVAGILDSVSFGLNSNCARHIRMTFVGFTAGQVTCGVVLGPYV